MYTYSLILFFQSNTVHRKLTIQIWNRRKRLSLVSSLSLSLFSNRTTSTQHCTGISCAKRVFFVCLLVLCILFLVSLVYIDERWRGRWRIQKWRNERRWRRRMKQDIYMHEIQMRKRKRWKNHNVFYLYRKKKIYEHIIKIQREQKMKKQSAWHTRSVWHTTRDNTTITTDL